MHQPMLHAHTAQHSSSLSSLRRENSELLSMYCTWVLGPLFPTEVRAQQVHLKTPHLHTHEGPLATGCTYLPVVTHHDSPPLTWPELYLATVVPTATIVRHQTTHLQSNDHPHPLKLARFTSWHGRVRHSPCRSETPCGPRSPSGVRQCTLCYNAKCGEDEPCGTERFQIFRPKLLLPRKVDYRKGGPNILFDVAEYTRNSRSLFILLSWYIR